MNLEANIPTIIDELYAGTLDDAAWHRGILGIAHMVSGASAVIFGFNPMTELVFRVESHDCDQDVLDQFCNEWFDKEIRLLPVLRCSVGEPIIDAQLMPIRTWQRSEIFNDFLYKVDKPWFLCFWLHKNIDKYNIFVIHGSRQRGPMDERDGELVKPIIPHLRRALEIRDRLNVSQVHADTLAKSLDNLSFGVLVLDANGRILEASQTAQALMRKDSGIRRNPDGTVWLREPAGAELDRWILVGTPPPHNNDGLLLVPRPHGRPVSVMVTPLPIINTSWISRDPRWMLLLFDPDRSINASTELIARDLGISEREAEITALLVAGYDPKKISDHLNISIHTTRTHLKAIFGKTGISSQVELIRRVASGPAVIFQKPEKF